VLSRLEVFDRRLGAEKISLGLCHPGAIIVILDLDQQFAPLDPLKIVHGHSPHVPFDLGAERRDVAANIGVVRNLPHCQANPKVPLSRKQNHHDSRGEQHGKPDERNPVVDADPRRAKPTSCRVLDIVIDDGLSDIVAGRFDAGIRIGERLEKDMIAVRLTPDIKMIAVASPNTSRITVSRGRFDPLIRHRRRSAGLVSQPGLLESEPASAPRGRLRGRDRRKRKTSRGYLNSGID
jgi:hypothetical protein